MDEEILTALYGLLKTIEWAGRGRILGPGQQPEPACPVCANSKWNGEVHDVACSLDLLIKALEWKGAHL